MSSHDEAVDASVLQSIACNAVGILIPFLSRLLFNQRTDSLEVTGGDLRRRSNLAGEPRDVLIEVQSSIVHVEEPVFELMALSRVALSAGALQRVLELGLQYATEREQFGRTISKFQVIQHTLAAVAAEVAAVLRSADAAVVVEVSGTELVLGLEVELHPAPKSAKATSARLTGVFIGPQLLDP